MNIPKKFLSLLVLSAIFSSYTCFAARSSGEPKKSKKWYATEAGFDAETETFDKNMAAEVEHQKKYGKKKGRKKLAKEDIWYSLPSESEFDAETETFDKELQAQIAEQKKLVPSKRGTVLRLEPEKKKKFDFIFHGYVRLDAFTDSRQNVDYWKGIDYSYPKPPKLDPSGRDINEKAQFTMVPFGKVIAEVIGPDVYGAKSSAVIKADIPGKFRIEEAVNFSGDPFGMFRYQHGYLNLDWERTKVLAGVYYSPLVLLELCADTVSINAGEFFDPFNYSAMVRVKHHADPFEFTFAVHKLFWYDQFRDSVAPSLFGQVTAHIGENFVTAGVNMDAFTQCLETSPELAEGLVTPTPAADQTLSNVVAGTPSTATVPDNGYVQHNSIVYWIAFIGGAMKQNNVTWKHRLTYAQCPFLYTLIGGFGSCDRNPKTDYRTCTTTASLSYWTELSHLTKNRELGVFVGYTKNLGARHKLVNQFTTKDLFSQLLERTEKTDTPFIYGEGTKIDHAFRIQPRVRWFHGPITLGIELEYTRAAYGTINQCGRVDVEECKKVSNTRLLTSIVYAF